MKAPLSWLSTYVSVPLDANDVAERLTLSGIEVERVLSVGVFDPLIVVAEVLGVSPVAGAQGVFRLDVRADRERSVISTASGVEVGQRLALALPGATLFGFDALSEVEVTEVYGTPSEGVIASPLALGVGRASDTWFSLSKDAEVGAHVSEYVSDSSDTLADRVLEISILPNIARCQSMLGVAREVAALFRAELELPAAKAAQVPTKKLSPSISSKDVARVLGLTLLEDVEVKDSSDWLKRRLVLSGMTPINNVVDASNYVMLELGQPTHPYDAERLPSLDLGVRRARLGERLLTLQQAEGDEPILLPEGVPLIVSGDVPVAVAGVIGGRATAISTATHGVLLESAAFEYVAIRKSQQAAKIFSEASARFSRGVNPELTGVAAQRFVEVLRETSPNLRVVAFGEVSLGLPAERQIELSLDELTESLGAEFSLDEALECLLRSGLSVRADRPRSRLVATVGNARADLTLPCDLVEEVARLQGYDRIPETMPREPIPERLHEDSLACREELRDALVRCGLQEIISYSLSGPDVEARLFAGEAGAAPAPPVPLLNPVSVERSVLRTSLLPGLLATAALNLRNTPVCRLFEIGPVFSPGAGPRELPEEREGVALLVGGICESPSLHDGKPRALDFFDLKAIVVDLLSGSGLSDELEVLPIEGAPYRPFAAARIVRGGLSYGTLGAVHPLVLRAFDLEGHAVFVADLVSEALLSDMKRRRPFREFDRLPSIELDIAMIIERKIGAGAVRKVVRDFAGPMLRETEVFDQFFDPRFGPNDKALAVRLRLNAGERTLEMGEALEVRARVARALEAELSAKIRE